MEGKRENNPSIGVLAASKGQKEKSTDYVKLTIAGLSFLGLFLVINHVFYLGLLGNLDLQNSYSYFLMAIYLSVTFLMYPSRRSKHNNRTFFFLDVSIFLLLMGICIFFAFNGYNILMKGWGASAPTHMILLSVILWAAIIEGTRRSSGLVLAIVATIASAYPLFAEELPGLLQGAGFSFQSVVAQHIMSPDSALGLPMTVVGNILIGYMIFGVALTVTGGGEFFLKLSMALLGHARGGVAKVAVIASAFLGSLSGSAISNVIATGSITIPMMKKTGYKAHYAAAVEACASNGGQLMPPIMGAVAFVMASFLNVRYLDIAIAAAVPSFLYYLGLLVQVDGQAAKTGLKGLPRQDLPSIRETLTEGWFYLFSLVLLMILLFRGFETQAPYYTAAFLFLVANIRKETRINFSRALAFFHQLAVIMCQLVPVLCAVGMIIGSLAMTGVAHAFPSEILRFAGGSLALMLILGAASSFILGMGMTAIAVYVFLAVILAPALVELGLSAMAVHMFLLYWGLLSFITPPVCIAVYPAASIAGASSMKAGLAAVRLGAVAFIIPFFFVINPALILEGGLGEIIHSIITASIGVFILASALEGYMMGVGVIGIRRPNGKEIKGTSYFLRVGFFLSGVLIAFPGYLSDGLGLLVGVPLIAFPLLFHRRMSRVAEV